MHILTITKTNGETLTLNVPHSIEEVTLRAKLDLDESIKEVLSYLADIAESLDDTTETSGTGYYLYLLSKGLTDFFIGLNQKVELNDFLAVDVSDLIENGEIKKGVLQSHVNNYTDKEVVKVEDVLPTILALWEYLVNLCNSYEPEKHLEGDLSFIYKEENFKIFRRTVDSLYGEQYEHVSVGELTEAFEISRKLNKLVSSPSIKLTEMLALVSILARKEGENLPLDDVENFIESRSKYFIDLPYTTAVEVFFYLTPSLNILLSDKTLNTFSTLLNRIE